MTYSMEEVKRNLLDAGCHEEEVGTILAGLAKSTGKEALAAHRKRLLDEIHEREERIGRLDYLLYRLKKDGVL